MADSSETPNLLNRPEAVVLILLAAILTFWDTYLALLDESGPSLSSRQLADRLGTTAKVIRRRKRQPGFSEWTQAHDPEGIAWIYRNGGIYAPMPPI